MGLLITRRFHYGGKSLAFMLFVTMICPGPAYSFP